MSSNNFGSGKPSKLALRDIYRIKVLDKDNGIRSLNVTEVPLICLPIQCESPEVLKQVSKYELADGWSKDRIMNVDILIGMDQYCNFVIPEAKVIIDEEPRKLVAVNTLFGWILSGQSRLIENKLRFNIK